MSPLAGKNPKKVYKFDPDYVVPTRELLREFMQTNGLTTTRMVVAGYVPRDQMDAAAAELDALLNDELLSEAAARVLGRACGSYEFWCNFEQNYRNGLARGLHVMGGD